MTTYEKIIQKGKQEGEMHKTRQTILKMDEKGFNTNLIAQVLEVSEDFVKTVLATPKGNA